MPAKNKGSQGLLCPLCGAEEALVVRVDSLELECTSCSETISRERVQAMLETWRRLLAWIDSAQPK